MKNKDVHLKKLPPHSDSAEKSILGAILLDNDALNKIVSIIESIDFYSSAHQTIYARMLKLSDKNERIDLITLSEALLKSGDLEMIGGPPYLMDVMESTPTSETIIHHARIVKEKSTLRKLIAISYQLNIDAFGERVEVKDLLSRAEELLMEISENEVESGFSSLADLVPNGFEAVEEIYKREGALTGIPTGFSDIDEMTSGLQKSDLIIVAGRPSQGKTSLALNISTHLAIKEKVPVAIFSLETSKEQLIQRMLCSEARVNSHALKGGFLDDKDWPKLTRAAGSLAQAPIYIDDTPGMTVMEMRAKARQLVKKDKNMGLIVVDYLQLMQGRGKKENRQQEISEISRSLKCLARELNIPLLALSQLSRAVENRRPPRPILSDLRESGAIEQDADVVMFIYRPSVYEKSTDGFGGEDLTAEIIISKQRNGPVGTAKLIFNKQHTRFSDISYEGG
jgi:replicative DNA helicase